MGGVDPELRARALRTLAETLDAEATLARLPGLTRDTLRAILLEASAAVDLPKGPVKARKVVLYTDGASRGNPGLSGAGAFLTTEDGRVVSRVAMFLGEMTNNMAEYTALLIGLKEARRIGAEEITIRSDSELLVRQLDGRYKVKNETLKILHGSALDLLAGFKRWKAAHIRREKNEEADRLANQAIDERP
ncbi:MAG: ribonuclease HI family protein [Deltaproteobacteria bacterium]|nr:ribonuclease HI family protein [Deltaproteobacteria bacterium]